MTRRIRILYALEAADSGALKHLVYLVTHLDPQDFAITVILSSRRSDRVWPERKKMIDAGATVEILDMERNISPWRDCMSLLKITKYLRRHPFDIVHSHSSKAGGLFRLAAWLSKVDMILYTPHCFYFQSKKGLKRRLFVFLEKCLGRITDYIIVSDNERKCVIEEGIIAGNKVQNINNAIKFEEYNIGNKPSGIRERFKLRDGDLVVTAVGRLSKQKNWSMYIKAANIILREFDQVVFLIVGDGELQADLSTLIRKHKLEGKMILTGYYTDISEIYSISDIVVNTSLWEGLPYVLLEAMWYKKPVIATDLNYSGFLLDEKNACLVKAADVAMLADKLRRLLADAEKRSKIGKAGALTVQSAFSFRLFIEKHEALYRKHFKL